MQTVQMGPLKVRVTGGTDGQGGGDGPAVVLLHGFGAPGDDLVGLSRVLQVPAGTRFVFPEAPLALDMPMMEGRAWWMIDVARIQAAMMTGQVRDLRRDEPAGLTEARSMMIETLDRLDEALSPAKVVLGGFSQGAMLTLDVVLHTDRPFAGLLLFSGTFLSEDAWRPRFAARAGMPVFQSHGQLDPLLPFFAAQELHEALTAAGWSATFSPFPGMHEIPQSAVAGANALLARVLAD